MRDLSRIILFLLLVFFIPFSHGTAPDLKKLIKVTKENNPKCVVYYNYKNQLYCSSEPAKASEGDIKLISDEKQNIMFDDRLWQAAWGNKTDDIVTIEYIPANDDINNWNELITSQFAPGLQDKVSPLQFSAGIIQSIKQSGFNPEVTYYEKSPDRVIFEFRITEPANALQDELQMISKGKDGLYLLHYVIKKPDMGKAEREKWLQNLKNSGPKENSQ